MMHDPCTAAAIIAGVCAQKDNKFSNPRSYVVREDACMVHKVSPTAMQSLLE